MVVRAVQIHGPEKITMENVMNVLKVGPTGLSDAECVKLKMMELGDWCVYFVMSNRDYGSLPDRWRVWWYCAKNFRGAVHDIDRFFMSIIVGAKVAGEIIDRSRYVFMDNKDSKAIC